MPGKSQGNLFLGKSRDFVFGITDFSCVVF